MDDKIPQTPPMTIEKKESELPDKPVVPTTYPDNHDLQSNIPISSDNNVEGSKEWIDYNMK